MFFFFNELLPIYIETSNKIYHYTSISALKNIISNANIWMTDYRFLNDYNEFNYGLSIFKEVLKDNKNINTMIKEQILERLSNKTMIYSNNLHKESSVFILSFSLDKDNKDLWNYYTKDNFGYGYNFEINPEHLKKDFLELNQIAIEKGIIDPLFQVPHGKIIYDLEKQKLIFSEAIEKIIKSHPTGVGFVSKVCDDILKLCFFMKDADFMNEHEYRIMVIFPKENLSKYTNNEFFPKYFFSESYGSFIPRLNLCFNLNTIKSITISPYNKMDFTIIGLEEFINSKGKKISYKKSKIKLRF